MPSNLERKARRKKQTRLTFDPIDRSSPSSHMSPAKVRYQLPGGQKQPPLPSLRLDDESDDILSTSRKSSFTPRKGEKGSGQEMAKTLPTPAKSSQLALKPLKANFDSLDEDEDEESNFNPFPSATKRRNMRSVESTQRNNIFGSGIGAGGGDSSEGSPAEEEEVITPSRRKRNTRSSASKPTSSTKSKRQKSITLSDDSDDDFALPVPRSTRRQPLFKPIQKPVVISDEDSDDEVLSSSRPRRRRPKSVTEDDESDELSAISKAKQPALASRGKQTAVSGDDSDDIVAPSSTNRQPRVAITRDEESDEEPVTSPLKRRRLIAGDSDSDIMASSPMKRRRRAANVEEDDESNSDLPSITRVSKAPSKTPATPNRVTRQQKPRRHRTEKEKTMELLKRKRAGEKITELTDSEESDGEHGNGGVYDTDSDLDVLSDFEDEEDSPEVVKPQKPKTKQRTNAGEDAYDSEFVVDDDETMLGVPDIGLNDIPLEFTHHAHKPLKEHFRDAVEWMVQNKINPGFSRNDPVYKQAFRKLNDEYQGLAKSKFSSTQWTHEFTKALNARPNFMERGLEGEEGIGVDGRPKCDACNHRSHIPSSAISFGGKAYNKETLEEIEQDSSSGSDDSSSDSGSDSGSKISVDEEGRDLPPESKEWFTGRFCRGNAEQAHILSHWRYQLNQWVLDTLRTQDLLTPAKLARRDAMSSSKRTRDALDVVDDWDANGLIKDLYRDFKAQLETAREVKGAGGKWGL